MKKIITTFAIVTLLFTLNVNAQEKISKRKKAKIEKASATSDKKECSTTEKKGAGCCAHKA